MAKFENFYKDFHQKAVKENFPFVKIIYSTAIFNLVLIAAVLILKGRLPPVVPLFYGLAEGEHQLVTNTQLILPSVLSVSFLVINLVIAYFMEDDFLKKVLILTPVAATLFSAITTIKIFFLVAKI